MEPSIKQQLDEQAAKLDAILVSVKKTEQYFRLIFWGTVILFVLPLIGLLFAVPAFINSYTSGLNGII